MKYLTNSGLSYFLNKIKAYLTSSTYLNSIGISNSEIDNIADDAGYSSGSLPASEDVFLTGDIIPNTDNSVDLGASSKNIKMIYTKGITIDEKTIDTDANGNMTYDGHIVDTIEEQGTGYIRYSNGIQICYGIVSNNNNLGFGITRVSFPKAFNANPYLTATPNLGLGYLCTVIADDTSTWQLHTFAYHNGTIEHVGDGVPYNFIAVGTWK